MRFLTKKYLSYLLIIFLCPFALDAQTIINGKVIDKNSLEPIIGALISANKIQTVTLEDGSYSISLPLGFHRLTFSYSGYTTLIKEIKLLDSQRIDLNIDLSESNILLDVAEISSSRFERPVAESPISIEVIQPKMTERLNSISAEQTIDKVPGIQIIDGQANIRGGSGYSYGAGSRVMLIMDDLQILQPDAGFTNWSDLPLENVGQIEIVKGAASALYGSAAMNGIIHFRTINPSLKPYTAIGIISRSFLEPKNNNDWWALKNNNRIIPTDFGLTFAHRKKFNKYDLTLGGMYRKERSFNEKTGSENFRINGTLVRHFSDKLIAGLGINYNAGSSQSFFYWDKSGSFSGDPGSLRSSNKVRFNIDPSIQYFTSKNYRHRILSRWLHIDNDNDNNQANKSDNIFSEYQIQKALSHIGLTFSTGILINYYFVQAPLFSDTIFKSNNLATYLQLEQNVFHSLKISAGVRYEYNRLKGPYSIDGIAVENPTHEDRPVFRTGLNYKIIEGTYLRSSYGQGFRFPTLAEKYIRTNAGGFNIIPNPSLHSEYGESFEIGIKQGLKMGRYQGLIDLSIFQSNYQDMIEFTLIIDKNFNAFYQAQNVGDTKIKGIELTNQGAFDYGNSKIVYNGGITLLDPKFQEWDLKGKDIPINQQDFITKGQRNASASSSFTNVLKYRNKELIRLDVEYQYADFFIGVNFTYASNVEAIDKLFESGLFINGVKEFRDEHNHGYRLYDFRIGYEFEKISLQLNMQNAMNEVYTLRPGLMEAPRSLGGRLLWKI